MSRCDRVPSSINASAHSGPSSMPAPCFRSRPRNNSNVHPTHTNTQTHTHGKFSRREGERGFEGFEQEHLAAFGRANTHAAPGATLVSGSACARAGASARSADRAAGDAGADARGRRGA
eukprot:356360-Chlamydomonas_euryale.AAC.1